MCLPIAAILTTPLAQFLMSLAMAVAALLLVLAVFGQSGEAKPSPQRAAAIAAGQEDRKTVFEYGVTRPVMWMLLRLAHRLRLPKAKEWVRRKLIASGNPNYYTPEEYVALSILSGLVVGLVLEICYMMVTQRADVPILLVGIVVGGVLSLASLHQKAEERLRAISRSLPYALDLISLAMGAGATFAEAIRTIVRESPEDPLNAEFRAVIAELELGTTRRRALENLAGRVPLDSMQSLVASVIQAEELGTPLGTVLHDQATLLRLERSVRAEDLAARASVRILVPCLLLVIAVMLVVFGPMIIQYARKGLF